MDSFTHPTARWTSSGTMALHSHSTRRGAHHAQQDGHLLEMTSWRQPPPSGTRHPTPSGRTSGLARPPRQQVGPPTRAKALAPATQAHAIPTLRQHGELTQPPDSMEPTTQLLEMEPTTQTSTNGREAELTDRTLGMWQEAVLHADTWDIQDLDRELTPTTGPPPTSRFRGVFIETMAPIMSNTVTSRDRGNNATQR